MQNILGGLLAREFRIGEHVIGGAPTPFIIAEAGVNHNGNMAIALALIDAAVDAGADAIKFQTFKADKLVTKNAPKANYQKNNSKPEESQYEMLKALELNEAQHQELMFYSLKRDIVFLSTPFEEESADMLERLNVPAFKLPSGEVTNIPFLEHVARKNRPIILSTGMSELLEVEEAVRSIRRSGGTQLALLHCVSAYPAPASQVNLRAMNTLASRTGCLIGFSDHTEGMEIACAAVALGACIIEKHFTMDRDLPGPDHKASLVPNELKAFVSAIRKVSSALGTFDKQATDAESDTARVARKSLVAATNLVAGSTLDASSIAVRRPGTGLRPSMIADVCGRTITRNINEGDLIRFEDLL